MAKAKTSWTEKLNGPTKDLPKIVKLAPEGAKRWGGESMYIPTPLEVDAEMKKVPKGELTTIDNIRKTFAKKHKTDIACPLTTGIFAWIAANAAEEMEEKGEKNITPYWRTLKSDGSLNPKYPGGTDKQAARLRAEGFEIDNSRKLPRVKEWEKYLT